jgi:hypothetical protein
MTVYRGPLPNNGTENAIRKVECIKMDEMGGVIHNKKER